MPRPPSAASSTCSDSASSPSHKRRHKHMVSLKDDDLGRDKGQWDLRAMIFLEEVQKPPPAKVIKLYGNTALIRSNQHDPFGQQSDSDVNVYPQGCRMIRRDELQLAWETTLPSRTVGCQRSPKKINIPDITNFLTSTIINNGSRQGQAQD